MWRVAAAVAAGLVLAVGGLVAVLSKRGTREAGSNTLVLISGVALPVPPGHVRCDGGQTVPRDTAAVRVYAGTFGRGGEPISVSVYANRRLVTSGWHGGGYGNNAILRVPLRRVDGEVAGATVCVRNLGARRLQFAGNRTPQSGPRIAGPEAIRFDWLLPDHPSYFGIASKVADRFSVIKASFLGSWSFWALFVVLAGLWACSIAVLVRGARTGT